MQEGRQKVGKSEEMKTEKGGAREKVNKRKEKGKKKV